MTHHIFETFGEMEEAGCNLETLAAGDTIDISNPIFYKGESNEYVIVAPNDRVEFNPDFKIANGNITINPKVAKHLKLLREKM